MIRHVSGEQQIAALYASNIGEYPFCAVYAAILESKRAGTAIEIRPNEYIRLKIEPNVIGIEDAWTGKYSADTDELLAYMRRYNAEHMRNGGDDLRLSLQYLFPDGNAGFMEERYLPEYDGDADEDRRRTRALFERYLFDDIA